MDVAFYNRKIEKEFLSFEMPTSTKIYKIINLLKIFGNRLGMPYSKQLTRNLFELRIRGQQEIRIFYCFYQKQAVIIHFFIKKSQRTPKNEIDLATKRVRNLCS